MKKWKQIATHLFVVMGMLVLQPTDLQAANNGTCPDEECDCCLDWGVDFLLWSPSVDDLEYAVKVGVDCEGEYSFRYRDVCFDWEPGFRIRALKPDFCSCWGIGGSYTYVYVSEKAKTKSDEQDEVYSMLLHPGLDTAPWNTIRAKYALRYQAWDVLLSRPFGWGCCHIFTPFFGVGGVALDQRFTSNMERGPERGKADWDSEYFGAGLKFGSEIHYQMYECFGIYARASHEILAGSADTKYTHKYGVGCDPETWEFKDDKCTHFINGHHIQFGVVYDWDCCGCETAFRFGYEFVKYHNVPNARMFFNDCGGENLISRSDHNDTTTIGFHGLFAGLDFLF